MDQLNQGEVRRCEFVKQIARMLTQDEEQTDTEDTINTLDALIEKARKLV